MDPISGSLALSGLISKAKNDQVNFGNHNSGFYGGTIHGTVVNQNYYVREQRDKAIELRRLERQVVEDIEDSDVNISILQEVETLFNLSSEQFPLSVKAAFKSCTTRQKSLAKCRAELTEHEEQKHSGAGEFASNLDLDDLKQLQISVLEASQSFRRSVLLFRDLVFGYVKLKSGNQNAWLTSCSLISLELVLRTTCIKPLSSIFT